VERLTALRSGDIVRLSPMGPNLTFKLVADAAGGGDQREGPFEAADEVSGSRLSKRDAVRFASAVALLVAVAVVLVLQMTRPETQSDPPAGGTGGPALRPFALRGIADQTAQEGQQLTVSAQLDGGSAAPEDARFTLAGRPPAGMEIDSETGEIRWTPTEQQGPGEYEVCVRAASANPDSEFEDFVTFAVVVEEVNQPPAIAAIRDRELDAEDGNTL
jgi:hypothetical protein